MENYTQLGLAGVTLAILFFVVRYFVQAMNAKDERIMAMTDKFINIATESAEARNKLRESIDANTRVTLQSAETGRKSADQLTALVTKILKNGK